jgi:hypothetical protein
MRPLSRHHHGHLDALREANPVLLATVAVLIPYLRRDDSREGVALRRQFHSDFRTLFEEVTRTGAEAATPLEQRALYDRVLALHRRITAAGLDLSLIRSTPPRTE